MATFINTLNRSKTSVAPGEKRFGERLNQMLEDDYLCWYDVPVGPGRRYPDFMILHPRRGLLIIEVKDWKRNTICMFEKLRVQIEVDGRRKMVDHPLEQARGYLMTVVNRLSRDPALCQTGGYHTGKLCFPYGYGVALPNITRRQFDEMLTEEEQDLAFPGRLVICRDEMLETTDPEKFQEQLWGMFNYSFGEPLTLPQIERIRWHLFPEIRINPKQGELFGAPDSDDSAGPSEDLPRMMRVMDIQQEQLARSLGSGHRVIHGVAGSGKTLILGHRCIQLAGALQKPILILCFNVSLAARLRAFVDSHDLHSRVHVHHFHEWCSEQLRTYHVPVMEGDEMLYQRMVETVIQGVEKGAIPRAQYGAVMIDEGQDFEPEWLKVVVQMLDPASDSLLLLYDDAQSIYRKSGGLDFSLSSVGVKAKGRTTILRLNYRNTREILGFAYDFARDFIGDKNADDDHIPLVLPETAGSSGPAPEFRFHESLDKEIDHAVRCLEAWEMRGDDLEDIAVIYFRSDHGRILAERLQKAGFAHLWMNDRKGKRAYDPRKSQVSILSVQSSKGLEFKSVILIGIGQLNSAETELRTNGRLLYVGMTRAKERLLLSASRENVFTSRLRALAG